MYIITKYKDVKTNLPFLDSLRIEYNARLAGKVALPSQLCASTWKQLTLFFISP